MENSRSILQYLLEIGEEPDTYIYLYEGHMGGIYYTETERTQDQLYCEQCGDMDYLIGEGTYHDLILENLYDLFWDLGIPIGDDR